MDELMCFRKTTIDKVIVVLIFNVLHLQCMVLLVVLLCIKIFCSTTNEWMNACIKWICMMAASYWCSHFCINCKCLRQNVFEINTHTQSLVINWIWLHAPPLSAHIHMHYIWQSFNFSALYATWQTAKMKDFDELTAW